MVNLTYYAKLCYGEYRWIGIMVMLSVINVYVFYETYYMDVGSTSPHADGDALNGNEPKRGSALVRYMDSTIYRSGLQPLVRMPRSTPNDFKTRTSSVKPKTKSRLNRFHKRRRPSLPNCPDDDSPTRYECILKVSTTNEPNILTPETAPPIIIDEADSSSMCYHDTPTTSQCIAINVPYTTTTTTKKTTTTTTQAPYVKLMLTKAPRRKFAETDLPICPLDGQPTFYKCITFTPTTKRPYRLTPTDKQAVWRHIAIGCELAFFLIPLVIGTFKCVQRAPHYGWIDFQETLHNIFRLTQPEEVHQPPARPHVATPPPLPPRGVFSQMEFIEMRAMRAAPPPPALERTLPPRLPSRQPLPQLAIVDGRSRMSPSPALPPRVAIQPPPLPPRQPPRLPPRRPLTHMAAMDGRSERPLYDESRF